MKNFILHALLLTTFLLSSCKDDEFQPESAIRGEWELVKMGSSWTAEVQEGDEMAWTETYVFRSNNTFEKTRNSADGEFQASGTFTWREAEMMDSSMAKVYLTLTFQTGEEIMGSCTADGNEELIITHQEELRNTWGDCDGPILHYRKK